MQEQRLSGSFCSFSIYTTNYQSEGRPQDLRNTFLDQIALVDSLFIRKRACFPSPLILVLDQLALSRKADSLGKMKSALLAVSEVGLSEQFLDKSIQSMMVSLEQSRNQLVQLQYSKDIQNDSLLADFSIQSGRSLSDSKEIRDSDPEEEQKPNILAQWRNRSQFQQLVSKLPTLKLQGWAFCQLVRNKTQKKLLSFTQTCSQMCQTVRCLNFQLVRNAFDCIQNTTATQYKIKYLQIVLQRICDSNRSSAVLWLLNSLKQIAVKKVYSCQLAQKAATLLHRLWALKLITYVSKNNDNAKGLLLLHNKVTALKRSHLLVSLQRIFNRSQNNKKLMSLTKVIKNNLPHKWLLGKIKRIKQLGLLRQIAKSVELEWYRMAFEVILPLSQEGKAKHYRLINLVQKLSGCLLQQKLKRWSIYLMHLNLEASKREKLLAQLMAKLDRQGEIKKRQVEYSFCKLKQIAEYTPGAVLRQYRLSSQPRQHCIVAIQSKVKMEILQMQFVDNPPRHQHTNQFVSLQRLPPQKQEMRFQGIQMRLSQSFLGSAPREYRQSLAFNPVVMEEEQSFRSGKSLHLKRSLKASSQDSFNKNTE